MDSLTLLEARHNRTHLKASVTRLRHFIENFDVSQGSRHDIIERKQRLTELWQQFDIIRA